MSNSVRSNGHRRVKSLVRELETADEQPKMLTPRASMSSLASTSSTHSSLTSNPTDAEQYAQLSSRRGSAVNGILSDPLLDAKRRTPSPGNLDSPSADEERDDFFPLTPVANTSLSTGMSSATGIQHSINGRTSATERREHSRRHSRIHSRNLSVFFPHPGGQQPWSDSELDAYVPSAGAVLDIPAAEKSSLRSSWSHSVTPENPLKVSQRRGHHHRHSVSHNFFTFLDADSSSAATNALGRRASVPLLSRSVAASDFLPSNPSVGLRSKYQHLPWPPKLFMVLALHLPMQTQLCLLLGLVEICLGASLWISGQSNESLSVTGLGYLVVFDGIAAVGAVIVEGNAPGVEKLWEIMYGKTERGLRHPYGTYRYVTLNHFAQCVYLLFSAVYVCKESIEHVLLLHGPTHDMATEAHGIAHGGMGHGESQMGGAAASLQADAMEVHIPIFLLVISISACVVSSFAVQNHATLVEAVGHATYTYRSQAAPAALSSNTARILSLLSNPFSLATIIFGSSLVIAGLTIPSAQLAPLDKVLALLESIAMFYVAYPAAEAIGKVLLQTAPPPDAATMAALIRALDALRDHPLVASVDPPHVWQLTPHPPPSAAAVAAAKAGGRGLRDMAEAEAAASIVVATIVVHAKHTITDDETLSLSLHVRERCAPALGREGELTVQIKRVGSHHSRQHDDNEHDKLESHESHHH